MTGPDLSLSETSPANLQQFQHTVLTSSSRSLGHASIKSTGQSTAVSVGTNISRPATTEIPKPVYVIGYKQVVQNRYIMYM